MRNDDENTAFILGAILAVITFMVVIHVMESNCQTENNVADCEWVSIPVVKEETSK